MHNIHLQFPKKHLMIFLWSSFLIFDILMGILLNKLLVISNICINKFIYILYMFPSAWMHSSAHTKSALFLFSFHSWMFERNWEIHDMNEIHWWTIFRTYSVLVLAFDNHFGSIQQKFESMFELKLSSCFVYIFAFRYLMNLAFLRKRVCSRAHRMVQRPIVVCACLKLYELANHNSILIFIQTNARTENAFSLLPSLPLFALTWNTDNTRWCTSQRITNLIYE